MKGLGIFILLCMFIGSLIVEKNVIGRGYIENLATWILTLGGMAIIAVAIYLICSGG